MYYLQKIKFQVVRLKTLWLCQKEGIWKLSFNKWNKYHFFILNAFALILWMILSQHLGCRPLVQIYLDFLYKRYLFCLSKRTAKIIITNNALFFNSIKIRKYPSCLVNEGCLLCVVGFLFSVLSNQRISLVKYFSDVLVICITTYFVILCANY